MIKAVIAVATFGVAAAVSAPAVAQAQVVVVPPAVVSGDDPIGGLLNGLLGGLLGGGGGDPISGLLGPVTGLLGGSGSPVEQLTGTVSGLTGGLGGVTGGLGGVTGALPGISVKRLMSAEAAQTEDEQNSIDALLDSLQVSLGSVPADLNGTVGSLGGVVKDVTGAAARLTQTTKDLTSTVEHVVGSTEGAVAEVARVTEFGNLITGLPAIGDLNLTGTATPLAGKATAMDAAVAPAVDAVSTAPLAEAEAGTGSANLVKNVTDTATTLLGGLAPALPAAPGLN
ncbi:hypothetical protein GCM10010160_53450 [Acrocarpospora corrugata]